MKSQVNQRAGNALWTVGLVVIAGPDMNLGLFLICLWEAARLPLLPGSWEGASLGLS
jgi:hypothetical protein